MLALELRKNIGYTRAPSDLTQDLFQLVSVSSTVSSASSGFGQARRAQHVDHSDGLLAPRPSAGATSATARQTSSTVPRCGATPRRAKNSAARFFGRDDAKSQFFGVRLQLLLCAGSVEPTEGGIRGNLRSPIVRQQASFERK
jgi:hypothetical protein